MNLQTTHKSVLLHESIDGLAFKNGDIFVDATVNGGGHSVEVAKLFGKTVKIVGIDLDSDALLRAKKRLEEVDADFTLEEGSFRDIVKILYSRGIPEVSKILFDLGLSSNQLLDSGRGFSFKKNEPLLMTFGREQKEERLTAKEIVNEWDESNIADVVYGYGEERYSRRIAKAIVETRDIKLIETTYELVEIIKKATPYAYHRNKTHFATRTFQALRMTVNDEVRALESGLREGFQKIKKGGRIAVISFHSIEDRVVKRFFRNMANEKKLILINKKPIVPTIDEVKANPRSRSAKLRIIEKL